MSDSCDPVDCSLPGSSAVEFSRQECWSGLPFPSPGDLPDPGTDPESPASQADSLPTELSRKPVAKVSGFLYISGLKVSVSRFVQFFQ